MNNSNWPPSPPPQPKHTHICIHTYTHTYIHTYIHTHIHTYTHTHTHTHSLFLSVTHTHLDFLMSSHPYSHASCAPHAHQKKLLDCNAGGHRRGMGRACYCIQCHHYRISNPVVQRVRPYARKMSSFLPILGRCDPQRFLVKCNPIATYAINLSLLHALFCLQDRGYSR